MPRRAQILPARLSRRPLCHFGKRYRNCWSHCKNATKRTKRKPRLSILVGSTRDAMVSEMSVITSKLAMAVIVKRIAVHTMRPDRGAKSVASRKKRRRLSANFLGPPFSGDGDGDAFRGAAGCGVAAACCSCFSGLLCVCSPPEEVCCTSIQSLRPSTSQADSTALVGLPWCSFTFSSSLDRPLLPLDFGEGERCGIERGGISFSREDFCFTTRSRTVGKSEKASHPMT
mmetsp:Transcript_47417/g.101495  ORF Transcript_47417/g.101495 Transcript_47417/m.101495 type:complete len:229 (+) Transcript_47417:1328-2014(+)